MAASPSVGMVYGVHDAPVFRIGRMSGDLAGHMMTGMVYSTVRIHSGGWNGVAGVAPALSWTETMAKKKKKGGKAAAEKKIVMETPPPSEDARRDGASAAITGGMLLLLAAFILIVLVVLETVKESAFRLAAQ